MIAAEILIPSRSLDAPAVIQTVGRSPAATEFAEVLAQRIIAAAPSEALASDTSQAEVPPLAAANGLADSGLADTGLATTGLTNTGLTDIVMAVYSQETAIRAGIEPAKGGREDVGVADVDLAEATLADVAAADITSAEVAWPDASPADARPVRITLPETHREETKLAKVGPADVGRADIDVAEAMLTIVGRADAILTDTKAAVATATEHAPAAIKPVEVTSPKPNAAEAPASHLVGTKPTLPPPPHGQR
jgi:hypothetical protein